MKKLVSLVILLFTFLISINQTVVYAARGVGHSKPEDGRLATYELYYHYSEEEPGYEGQHRLTLSVYDFRDTINDFKWDIHKNIEENGEIYMRERNVMYEIIEKFPRLRPYFNEIQYQVLCHEIGQALGEYQDHWDMEIQRERPSILGLVKEIDFKIGDAYIWEGNKCNRAHWIDNKLLFHPGVKFHGQLPYPNQWISYKKSGKPIYYYVGEDYVGVTGWKFIDAWYYFNDFAVMQTGWLSYNNKWYYLHESGRMLTGVKWIGENYYALNPDNGELRHSGWIQDNGNWYYSHDVGGSLLRNTWYKIDGSYYYFNNDATMKKGWLKYNNYWYFLQDNGVMVTGWKDIGESRYYFKTSGEMVTGVHVIGGVEYEFNSSGHLIRTGKKVNINPCDKYTCIYPYEDPTTVVEEGEN